MSYMGWHEWMMFVICMILVLPWLLGGLLVIKDMKARYDRRRSLESRK